MTKKPASIGDNSNERLKSFSERINNLLDEQDRVKEDLKELYAECKGEGFSVKALKKAVGIARKDVEKWKAEEEELDLYLQSLGVL